MWSRITVLFAPRAAGYRGRWGEIKCRYLDRMVDYKFTEYFEKEVLRKRPYLKKEWCIRVIQNPLKIEPQEHNRFRSWGIIDEFGGRMLRVVTLEDKQTIHNAFPDRGFKT